MNLYLQLGLGIFPGVVVCLIFLFKRKAFRLKSILLSAVLVLTAGTLLYFGFSAGLNNETPQCSLSRKELMAFANALAERGAYSEVDEVLDEYSIYYGYDDDCRLLSARVALMKGDHNSAFGLYSYLSEKTKLIESDADERELAGTLASGDKERPDEKDIRRMVKEAIENQYSISDDAVACAEAVAGISDAYTDSDSEEEESSSGKTRRYARKFEDLKNKDYLDILCVRKAKIKADVLASNYSGVTTDLSSKSSYHELMIAAELYMGGLVDEKDFPASFRAVDSADASAVTSRLNSCYERTASGLSKTGRKVLKFRISAISKALKDPALLSMKELLTGQAEGEAGADRTKVYLELAKIENYFGNDVSTNRDISTAIYSSQDNEDDSYVMAMAQIISVLKNDPKSDSGEIKNVSQYVATVLDHSLTVNVEEIISPQEQEIESDNTDNDNTESGGKKKNPFEKNNFDSDGSEKKQSSLDGIFGTSVDVTDGGGVKQLSATVALSKPFKDEDAETKKASSIDFGKAMVNAVSKQKSGISIGKIDVGNFPNIVARATIRNDSYSDTNDLKNALRVADCNVSPDSFDLEKITYSGSNILLVCDVSGSMGGSMEDLKSAVVTFVNEREDNEKVGIVTFSNGIQGTESIGTTDQDLVEFAEGMLPGGGTDMYSALVSCLSDFPSDSKANNVVILMTDGQDNNPKSAADIESGIGKLAVSKGITVYTLGLGSEVDTAYLQTIANSGNGDFVYVSSSDSLVSFYDMLHSQVQNQYEISYKAKDTMTQADRILTVSLPDQNLTDMKYYSLPGAESDGASLQFTQDLKISGINPRWYYQGQKSTTAQLKGEGFEEKSDISLRLNGTMVYDYSGDKLKFVDAETYSFDLPNNIGTGNYNVEVTIDGKTKIIPNGFQVIDPNGTQETKFGPYRFTSCQKDQRGNFCILSGAVTMNGWLHFKGDITIEGDLDKDNSVQVTDVAGSYINYDANTAEGFGKILANKGVGLEIPAFDEFTLYNNSLETGNDSKYYAGEEAGESSNYPVDDIMPGGLELWDLLTMDDICMNLYPDCIDFSFTTGHPGFPFLNKILNSKDQRRTLKSIKNDGDAEMFLFQEGEIKLDDKAKITDKNIGLVLKIAHDEHDIKSTDKYTTSVNFLGSEANINGDFELDIDTIQNKYKFEAMIRLGFFSDASGVALGMSWDDALLPDSITFKIKPGEPVTIPACAAISVTEFGAECSGIKDALEQSDFTKLSFKGEATLKCMEASAYVPKTLAKLLGDPSLFEMPETSITLDFSKPDIEATAKLNLFEKITLLETELKVGKDFDFSGIPILWDLTSTTASGIDAKLKAGFSGAFGDNDALKFDISGSGRFDINNVFFGTIYQGTANLDLDLWMFHEHKINTGSFAEGLYFTHSGNPQYIVRYVDSTGHGRFFSIDKSGIRGAKRGEFTL